MTRFSLFFLFLFHSCNSSSVPLNRNVRMLSSTYGYMTQTEQDAAELPYTETVEFVSDGLILTIESFPGPRVQQANPNINSFLKIVSSVRLKHTICQKAINPAPG